MNHNLSHLEYIFLTIFIVSGIIFFLYIFIFLISLIKNFLNCSGYERLQNNNKKHIYSNELPENIDKCCSICNENITKLFIFTQCNHAYHFDCIKKWYETSIDQYSIFTCPICRYEDPELFFFKEN